MLVSRGARRAGGKAVQVCAPARALSAGSFKKGGPAAPAAGGAGGFKKDADKEKAKGPFAASTVTGAKGGFGGFPVLGAKAGGVGGFGKPGAGAGFPGKQAAVAELVGGFGGKGGRLAPPVQLSDSEEDDGDEEWSSDSDYEEGESDPEFPTSEKDYYPLGTHVLAGPELRFVLDPADERELKESISEGRAVKKAAADAIARDMMTWAMNHGALSFAHWASPLRGPNALLKHEMFIDLDFKENMEPITKFSGSKLFFSETDGSSFPNGGLRATHTAAAYLTWDKTSPPFVRNKTLYIPSAFISWNGDALDEKVPLLRSQRAVNRAGKRLLKHLGEKNVDEVVCNVGWEQEFFLIDREVYLQRPDLVAAGRTLFGAPPPRGQQTDQNYFTRVPPRAKQVLEEVQTKLHRLGVPLMVYHSEVAPSQFEFAPIFSAVNAAADSNVLAMDVLQETAQEHGMVALFHEKPFAGLNGSGKHSNWGLNIKGDDGKADRNLFVPGKTPEHQRSFMAMTACLLRAVHRHGDLIRCSVASAGNDHRLGAQEAPPAIISLYLGKGLGDHVDKFAAGKGAMEGYGAATKVLPTGADSAQPIAVPIEDRNRTAPFPFCGNRFEFRAVGSDFHIGFPLTVVQAAMAESMNEMADELDKGRTLDEVVRETFSKHAAAVFNGNGYSKEWQEVEAVKRGLPNLRTTVDALETMCSDKNVKLMDATGVLRPHELHARQEIYLEKYQKVLLLEANCLIDLMETGVLPACAGDLQRYAGTQLGGERPALYQALRIATDKLADLVDKFPYDEDVHKQARHALDVIKPAMMEVRIECDQAERLVAKDIWPFPNYHEIFFEYQSGPRDDAK
jgi:glutamine synthetase